MLSRLYLRRHVYCRIATARNFLLIDSGSQAGGLLFISAKLSVADHSCFLVFGFCRVCLDVQAGLLLLYYSLSMVRRS